MTRALQSTIRLFVVPTFTMKARVFLKDKRKREKREKKEVWFCILVYFH